MLVMAETERPRRGRPAKAPDERLSEIIRLRVTRTEADAAYRYAIRHGEPLNAVLRRILLRLLERRNLL